MNNLVAKIIEHMEEVNISNDQGCTPLQVLIISQKQHITTKRKKKSQRYARLELKKGKVGQMSNIVLPFLSNQARIALNERTTKPERAGKVRK